ncbi:hypothetical protein OXPF_34560 [Oxobacter pfennigii]|uniref:Uncharacterized protein n=1 Tax=Oxobacter pfennigii TaxID=36849 RepID=A0A0N8NSU7_9CLOT|nr:hypothetical protein OXPF_34560 [Oxobacter pfennigii]
MKFQSDINILDERLRFFMAKLPQEDHLQRQEEMYPNRAF